MPAINETTDWLGDLSSAAISDINAYSYGYAVKGDAISGTLDLSGDVDLVRIPMAAQESYRISVTGNASISLIDDSYLNNKATLATPASDGTISWTAVHPSAFYFVIVSGSGAYTLNVDGVVADGLVDEAGNDSTTTATLSLNQSVGAVINGRNTTADVDWFAVDLLAGQKYSWQMTPTNSVVGATAGGLLNLYDASGTAINSGIVWGNSAWTDGASLSITPTTSGLYYIETAPYGFNESGSYVLSMTDGQTAPASVLTVQGTDVSEPSSGSSQANVVFSLSQSSSVAITANYRTIAGTATADADFVSSTGTLSFAPGETSKQISLSILGDTLTESKEYFYVQITEVSNAKLDSASGIFAQVGISDTPVTTGTSFVGTSGADSLTGSAGSDTLDGGGGIDTLTYTGKRANFSIAQSGTNFIATDSTGAEGTDTVANIERLIFSDSKLALDVSNGNAGTMAKILGALLGPSSVTGESYSKQYMGIGLTYLDGGMSYQNLMSLALEVRLDQGFSTADEINLLYKNLAGSLPSAADLSYWTGVVSSGQLTQTSLAVAAADHDLNTTNINLTGLAQTGIEYI